MPNVSFEKTSDVLGKITVDMSKQELNEKINAELKKQRGKVSMKGFRKGKVPMSTLRKMMGNDILGQILDNEVRESLFGYIEENKIDLIFSPRPIEEEGTPMITASNVQDLSLKYEVAIEPEFSYEIPNEAIDYYVLDVPTEDIDKAVSSMLKRAGKSEELTEGAVGEDDVLSVTFTEAGPVEEKITNSTKLYLDALTDESKELFLGKEIGDTVTVADLSTLENDSTDTYVKKYFLDLEDVDTDITGKSFDVKIDGITRVTPSEMTTDFFKEYDPSGAVATEGELRDDIVAKQSAGFQQQADGMANFAIQKALVENTTMELPEEFMREVNKGEDTPYDLFERGVRWMLIRNKFAADEEIKLEYEDIKEEAVQALMQMLGGQRPDFLTDDFIESYVQRALQDEEQRNQLSSNAIEKKIMAALRDKVTLNEISVDADAFNDVIKQFNEENNPTPAAAEEE
ncbi:trigger factor [Lewinella sp. 4G2]|uniref:trigger factor n=1 Tax=Lewinella sp. 4G2 TaxID=1803372 RepID=UPI000AE71D46|nr:trigger factor [Lewinella sp. 4G2]